MTTAKPEPTPTAVNAVPVNNPQTASMPTAANGNSNEDYVAIGSLVLGLINLCSWFIPLCGCPMSIIGIVLGIVGLKSTKYKTMAIIGLILSALGLIITLINGFAGALISINR